MTDFPQALLDKVFDRCDNAKEIHGVYVAIANPNGTLKVLERKGHPTIPGYETYNVTSIKNGRFNGSWRLSTASEGFKDIPESYVDPESARAVIGRIYHGNGTSSPLRTHYPERATALAAAQAYTRGLPIEKRRLFESTSAALSA